MLSERDNFLRALGGDVPEYIPRFTLLWGTRPSILNGARVKGVGKDIFGVEWTNEGSAFEEAIPKTSDFILTDIRQWRDVIKFPDFSNVDWETMSRKDLQNRNPELPLGGGLGGGVFQNLVAFMGFSEGLLACFEEPEEVIELINYLCDSYLSLADNFLKYYKPDYITFGDDIATERSTFVSLDMFRGIFAPVWRRYIKYFKDRGYLVSCHNCGHFEAFLDDAVDMGINSWDPAQTSNDLLAIKKKFGNRLLVCGGFDARAFLPHIDISEEEVRAAIRKLLDDLAPGGGYAFGGINRSISESHPLCKQRAEWAEDEFAKIRATYYQ